MMPETGSLLAGCAIAFGGALVGGGLQWIVLRDTKGDLGAGGGLSMTLGLCVAASLGMAMSVAGSLSGIRMATVLGSHALGWAAVWLLARKRRNR
jgi:hypothetical protein